MKENKWIFIGLTLSSLLWGMSYALDLHLFDSFVSCLQMHRKYGLDELFFPGILFYLFLLIHMIKRQHNNQLKIEKLKVYKSMLGALHHILNNFLQKMMLFKMTAEETPDFNPTILALYDTIIDEASAQIKALGSISHPNEENISKAIAPGSAERLDAS